MASMNTYPSPTHGRKIEVATSRHFQRFWGVRPRPLGGYAAVIRHGNRRIYIGFFDTDYEAGIAFDMAALRLRHKTYNFRVDANGRIITEMDPAKQDSIEEEVVKQLKRKANFGAGDAGP